MTRAIQEASGTATRLDEIASGGWDVIVIGAGVAGAVTAIETARVGLRTLLVEAKSFPRDKVCGGCLSARGQRLLEQRRIAYGARLGVPLREVEFLWHGRRLRLPMEGVSLARRTLDELLVQQAIAAGAQVVTQTRARVGTPWGKYRCVELQGVHRSVVVRGRVAVAADGLSRGSDVPEPSAAASRHRRIGIGAILAGRATDCFGGRVCLALNPDGYVGLTHLHGRRLNLAAAVDPSLLRTEGPAQLFQRWLEEAGLDVSGLNLNGARWAGTVPLNQHPPSRWGHRLFQVGDASGYVEPFTGEGMALAVEGAVLVSELVVQAQRCWDDALGRRWEQLYQQRITRRQIACRTLCAMLKSQWQTSLAFHLAASFPRSAARISTWVTGAQPSLSGNRLPAES